MIFFVVQEAVKLSLVIPNKRTATQQYVKITPSRRVASKKGFCGVTNLGNEMTIACNLCLASNHFC